MTAAVAAVRLRAERLRVAVSADALALGSVAAFSLGLLGLVWGTWGDLDSDTGYDLVAGMRIADGDVPYRDFVYFYGPLAPALSAVAVLVGGSALGSVVTLGLLVAAAIVVATYALARTVLDPLGAALAAALTAAVALIPNNYSFVVPHTHGATLGTLGLLALLLCLIRSVRTGGRGWLVAAGACAGLVALTKPEQTFAAAAVGVAFLLTRRFMGELRGRDVGLLLAPAVAIPALAYGALAAVVGPSRLVFDNLYPVDELEAGGDTMLGGRMPLTPSSIVEQGGRLALYAAGIAFLVLVAHALSRPGRFRRPLLVAIAVAGLGAVAASFINPEAVRHGLYYVYGWVPAGAAVAVLVLFWRHRRSGWTASRQAELLIVTALAALAFTCYSGFYLHAPRPQMAVYAVPLIAIFLARLHIVELVRSRAGYVLGVLWIAFLVAVGAGLTLKDASAESATVRGPGGAIAETSAEASLYQSALDVIAARTEPGEPILVAPLMTGLYPLSDRTSALPELSLLPGALPTEADERAAIARLEEAGVRLAITDNREWPGYGHTSFGESFDRELARWIEGNFNHAATIRAPGDKDRALDVWLKRRVP